ncbi:MAG: antibiotic biosynthesis monooxygenase [Chloroflexi bacterium]|nr:antibiotic biosynthesis monooxygenase [Chloroflexota bacterium]
MYGTVARIRVKPGGEKALLALMDEWNKQRKGKVKGAVATYVYRLDKDPNQLVMAVVFKDKKSYTDNANDPEQDKWYRRFREQLQSDPVWDDGEIVATG